MGHSLLKWLFVIIFFIIKYGFLFLFIYLLWDLLRPLPKEKKLSKDALITYKRKKLSEYDIYQAKRSKRRLTLLVIISLIFPVLLASILIFYPVLLEGFAFLGLLSGNSLHFILILLSLFFISLTLAAILHISGYYRASSYISVAALCIYPYLLIFHPFLPEYPHSKLPSSTEDHGKLSVKLSKKFSINFPNTQVAVAWSPDSSILAVAGLWGSKIFDSSGQQISTFQTNGETITTNFLAFINGSSRILYRTEGFKNDAVLDIRDMATGVIVKTIPRTRSENASLMSTEYLAVSSDQKRFAVTDKYHGASIKYGSDDGNSWQELPVTKAIANERTRLRDVSLCFFPDNRRLAIGKNNGHFDVVDSATGETLNEYIAEETPDIDDNISAIAVSPRGDLIMTGLNRLTLDGSEAPKTKPWNSSDHAIVSIWRVSDGKQVAAFSDPGEEIWQAIWDPKGRFVAFVESDSLIVWQPETMEKNFIRIRLSKGSNTLAISPDGKSLAVTNEKSVTVYNIEDSQEIIH